MAETQPSSSPDEAFTTAPSDQRLDEAVAIPTYESAVQFTVEDLEDEVPDWREHTEMEDPELVALTYLRSEELRRLMRETGIPMMNRLGGSGLEWALDQIDREVGRQFDAHGIAGKTGNPVTELDALLTSGIDTDRPFYSMGMTSDTGGGDGAFGAPHPFTEGGIIVVGNYGEKLLDGGIGTVVLGEEYMRGIEMLRNRYPEIEFVAWNEAPAYFIGQFNEAEGDNREFPDPSEPVNYHTPDIFGAAEEDASGPIPVASSPTELGEDGPDVW